MADNTYKAKVIECSRELSVHERIQFKDVTGAFKINEMIDMSDGKEFRLESLEDWAVIAVHNEKSKNPDYNIYLFTTSAGEKYTSSSESMWRSFKDICEELAECGEGTEGIDLIFSSHPSKTQQNNFIKCRLG